MIDVLVVEDNAALRKGLVEGLAATGEVRVVGETASGEAALEVADGLEMQAALMDVQLAGPMNGIQAAVALRRERPRLPVVFYSIQDDDEYYRDFRQSGILTHYAYVRKSNYLLPQMIVPLLRDALTGRSFIDPDIAARVQEVRQKDEGDPLALLEPNEREVVHLLALGMTNEQIAARLGIRDKRAVSRTNGQIYTTWGLNTTAVDEKVARARAVIMYQQRRFIMWDEDGTPLAETPDGRWAPMG